MKHGENVVEKQISHPWHGNDGVVSQTSLSSSQVSNWCSKTSVLVKLKVSVTFNHKIYQTETRSALKKTPNKYHH